VLKLSDNVPLQFRRWLEPWFLLEVFLLFNWDFLPWTSFWHIQPIVFASGQNIFRFTFLPVHL